MKNILLLIIILSSTIAKSQAWVQNFNSTTVPNIPTGWMQNNVDGLTSWSLNFTIGTNAWITYDLSAEDSIHKKVAVSSSAYWWMTTKPSSNDWLISPQFTMPAHGVLEWEEMIYHQYASPLPTTYQVKISTTGTLTTDFTTVFTCNAASGNTWKAQNVDLNSYSGQNVRIAFVNNSDSEDDLLIDNITIIEPKANDIKLSNTGPTSINGYGAIGTTKTVTGKITNRGYNTITTFTANYNDGIVNSSNVFSGLNLTYNQSYNFSFSTPYTINSATLPPLKVWANLTGDIIHSNDTLLSQIKGYSFVPNHKIAFEEATGTWCGECVRGIVYMDSMYHMHPDKTVLIAIHTGDTMTNIAYDEAYNIYGIGWPNVSCERTKIKGGMPEDMFTMYNNHINDFGVADLTVSPTINQTTRVASINVTTTPASGFKNNTNLNDYRIAVVITENNVTGTTYDFAQHNAYANTLTPLVGGGHHFNTEPSTIPASNMKYDFVARELIGGFYGRQNSLPNNLVAGMSYNTTFSYTVPAYYNMNNININALLIDANNKVICNANNASLITSIKQIETKNYEFNLFPNPASNKVNINFESNTIETITITICNTLGNIIYSETVPNTLLGKNTVSINTQNFADGLYTITISNGLKSTSQKVSIIK